MGARWLETDTASNQNIASATTCGAYTADADRLVIVDVSVDQVAGNGDYVMYVTRQIAGAGSSYIILPKTTMAAASGETAISGQSGMIAVRSGDVLTVYVDGLAGDTTTPDYTTRWFEVAALVPTTADRTLDVTAGGLVNGMALEATLTAMKGASWTDETLAALMTAIEAISAGSGASAAEVWAYAARTLTQSAASVTATVTGSDITCQRGDTLSASLTDVGALTGYSKVYFTVKQDSADADSASIIQIVTSTGLLYLNGAAGTAAKGSITITDEATGDITIALDESETAKLNPGSYSYDVQVVRTAGTVSTLTEGTFEVAADVTRATT